MANRAVKVAGILLVIAGAAVLVYAIVLLIDFGDSAAGRLAEGARRVDRALLGGGNVGLTTTEKEAIMILIAGFFACVIGTMLIISQRRGR